MRTHTRQPHRANRRGQALRQAVKACNFEALENRRLLAGDIAGHVFNDLNGDGIKDVGENGLQNFRVYIDQNANDTYDVGEPQVFTNAQGNYTFSNQSDGEYDVRLSPPDNWVTTLPNGGEYIVDTTGGNVNGRDFGTQKTVGAVRGRAVFYGGSTPAEFYEVYVDMDLSGTKTDGDIVSVVNAAGQWQFLDLVPGEYSIRINPGPDYLPSANNWEYRIINGQEHLIYLPGDGITLSTTVVAGQDERIGIFRLSPDDETTTVISGKVMRNGSVVSGRTVFIDANDNGVLDSGERAKVSDHEGTFVFSALEPGTYSILILPETGDMLSNPADGKIVVAATDPLLFYDNLTFNLSGAEATISGVVFNDTNGNGVKDVGETGRAGATVYLDNGNGVLDTGEVRVTTDANGNYSFEDLVGGYYAVRIVSIVNATITAPSNGKYEFYLPSAAVSGNNDFGVALASAPGTISGTVFNDLNGNGIKDTGEAARAGAIVYLDTNNNGVKDTGEQSAIADANGAYAFNNLDAGDYNIRVVLVTGYTITGATDGVYQRTLAEGGTSQNNNFGFASALTGDYVRNDFNGDGRADLLFRNNGITTVWYMNGLNRTGTATLPEVGAAWSLGATGDFNGDGKTDIVWHNNATGASVIWLMNGIVRTGSVALPDVNTAFRIHGAGDFDNDGNTDLVFRSTTTGAASVWYMNGTALRQNDSFGALPQVLSQNWQIADVQDYDGDGDPDLLWTNATTKQNSLWLMNERAVANDGFRGIRYPTAAGWRLAGVSDFNADGTPDLLWANNAGSSVWLLDDVLNRPVGVGFTSLVGSPILPA